MKIGCDNSVVRLVSSGNYINRVSFQYRLLEQRELPKTRENSLDNFCAVEWDYTHTQSQSHSSLCKYTSLTNAVNTSFVLFWPNILFSVLIMLALIIVYLFEK